MSSLAHSLISPAILYWGTPVVLISSENEDASTNICAMSSAWWLDRSCVLGLGSSSKTAQNLLRTRQCVLNLVSDDMAANVNELADTTGLNPVPESKKARNYMFVKDKWAKARLTPQSADVVRPLKIAECPVQMECELVQFHGLRPDMPERHGAAFMIEVRVLRVHIVEELRMAGHPNRINPEKWRPLLMSFQQFFGIRPEKVAPSVLGRIDEEKYRITEPVATSVLEKTRGKAAIAASPLAKGLSVRPQTPLRQQTSGLSRGIGLP